jgi:hypothetical protein
MQALRGLGQTEKECQTPNYGKGKDKLSPLAISSISQWRTIQLGSIASGTEPD